MSEEVALFNDDEIDYFKELLNIGHGHSAAIMAELLDEFVTLSVPEIAFCNKDDFEKIFMDITRNNHYITVQGFWGSVTGETLLVMDNNSMGGLRKIFDEDEVEDDDIVLELMNIMNATLISRLAMELSTEVSFDIPRFQIKENLKIFTKSADKKYQQAIILRTLLQFKDIGVDIEMIVFMHDEAIQWIRNVIKTKINELLEWS